MKHLKVLLNWGLPSGRDCKRTDASGQATKSGGHSGTELNRGRQSLRSATCGSRGFVAHRSRDERKPLGASPSLKKIFISVESRRWCQRTRRYSVRCGKVRAAW